MGVHERRDGAITVITIDRPQAPTPSTTPPPSISPTRSDASALTRTPRSWS